MFSAGRTDIVIGVGGINRDQLQIIQGTEGQTEGTATTGWFEEEDVVGGQTGRRAHIMSCFDRVMVSRADPP